MTQPLFLKLGGSLITDKTGVEVVREDVLVRLSREIAEARKQNPTMELVLGHGSGSFGHVAGAKFGTRQGVKTETEWGGFAEVSDAASRLNRLVIEALLAAGVPAISLQPSASAICEDGQIISLADEPVRRALNAGLLPVVYGDVAFDNIRGGTIISTEEVLIFLARSLRPAWFLLAGETPGVLDADGQVVLLITADNFDQIAGALGRSRGTDVTGGMASKVLSMLDLVQTYPNSRVRLFTGLEKESLLKVLIDPAQQLGTELRSIRFGSNTLSDRA
ncbi:MAG: isopentenyl phosphate kinase [Candidatus Promineifilaceae bacterium]